MLLQVGLSAFHINLFLGCKFSADPIEGCQNGLQCTWRVSTEKLARDPCTLNRLRKKLTNACYTVVERRFSAAQVAQNQWGL